MNDLTNKSLLFILESPSKAKTISFLLQKMDIKKYKIVATKGHIKDLPKKSLGFQIKNGKIIPYFYFLPQRKKIIDYLRKLIKEYNYVILATDPDREGEAIAYHVYSELNSNSTSAIFKRAFINEITLNGIKKGLENLSNINYSMVESQLARRLVDRVIGYKISPVLWKNFKIKGLSAGRVQTATLELIFQREQQIQNFKPQKYFVINITFRIGEHIFDSFLYHKNEVFKIHDQKELENFEKDFLQKIIHKKFRFNLEEDEKEIIPPDPLKTSTLQQEAAKIGIDNSQTMKIAQKLYEGVFIGSEKKGLITYHRTDSIRVSREGIELAQKMLPKVVLHPRRNKTLFDAHEAIRITYPYSLNFVKKYLSSEEFKIYELIYRRFLASLSPSCKYFYQEITANLSNRFFIKYESGKIKEKGFFEILPELMEKYKLFKNVFINKNEIKTNFLEIVKYELREEYTKPPARYTVSSIVKKMEEVGIGRPSTYATTIEILKKRKYIYIKDGVIFITELGKKVIEFLKQQYAEFLNIQFTAELENFLDKIENMNFGSAHKLATNKVLEIYSKLSR